MSRAIYRLTGVAVTNAKSKGLYPDGGGLYLRVTSTGTKSWILRFKRDGRTRDMGLGPLGLISLARARELAAEGGRQRLQGLDPIKARDTQRAAAKGEEASALTFKDCAEQLIESYEAGWRNPAKHAKLWRHTLLKRRAASGVAWKLYSIGPKLVGSEMEKTLRAGVGIWTISSRPGPK